MKKVFTVAAALLTALGTTAAVASENPASTRHGVSYNPGTQSEPVVQARALGGRGDRVVTVRAPQNSERVQYSKREVKGSGPILTGFHGPANQPFRHTGATEFQVAPLK